MDPKSRHKGKLDTESLLEGSGVNYTSVRPVYIYGPLNYNPVVSEARVAALSTQQR